MPKRTPFFALAALASLPLTLTTALAADTDALSTEQFAAIVAAFDEAPHEVGTNVDRLSDSMWAQIDAAYTEFESEPYLILMAITPPSHVSEEHSD